MSISKTRLLELERAEKKLIALEAGGVDDWEFYDDSLEDYNKEELQMELRETFIDELSVIFRERAYVPSERGAGIAFTSEIYGQVEALCTLMGVTLEEAV